MVLIFIPIQPAISRESARWAPALAVVLLISAVSQVLCSPQPHKGTAAVGLPQTPVAQRLSILVSKFNSTTNCLLTLISLQQMSAVPFNRISLAVSLSPAILHKTLVHLVTLVQFSHPPTLIIVAAQRLINLVKIRLENSDIQCLE